MKEWTIGKRIKFGFACIILIAIVLGVFSYVCVLEIARYSDEITKRALPINTACYQLQINLRSGMQKMYMNLARQKSISTRPWLSNRGIQKCCQTWRILTVLSI